MKSQQLFKLGVILCALGFGLSTVFVPVPRLPEFLLCENSETDSSESNDEEKVELAQAQRRSQRGLRILPMHDSHLRLPMSEANRTSCITVFSSTSLLIPPMRC